MGGGSELSEDEKREGEELFLKFCTDQYGFRKTHHEAPEPSVGRFVARIKGEGRYRKLWLAKGQMFGGQNEIPDFRRHICGTRRRGKTTALQRTFSMSTRTNLF